MKVDVERFGCNNFLQDFKFMKNVVKIAINIWWNNIVFIFSRYIPYKPNKFQTSVHMTTA